MELLIKALIGAAIVVLITIVAATKNYFIAGLIPLFPAFALVAHVAVGQKGVSELKNTAAFGMLSLIPYFIYLLSVYYLANKLPLYLNLIISVFLWFTISAAVYLFWIKFKFA